MKRVFILFTLVFFIVGCGNKSKVVIEDSALPDHFIANELIVQLKDGVKPELLETKFSDKGFTLKEELSVHMRAYLFSFDDNVINPKEMIELVRSLEEVSSVEFNKDLQLRE